MKRILVKLRFDGSGYHGWQIQRNAVTVQQTVGDALSHLTGNRARDIIGCSRTDSGVHANAFYFHFDTDSGIPPENLVNGLNSKLPPDISALHARYADGSFHARYSAVAKQYIYKFYFSRVRDPFREKYALRRDRPFDLDVMNRAAAEFTGTHDFSAFCAAGGSAGSAVRTLGECRLEARDGEAVLKVTGNGFLYNMVRIMAGTLLEIADGKIGESDIPAIIAGGNREAAGKTAPARGLYLNRVYY